MLSSYRELRRTINSVKNAHGLFLAHSLDALGICNHRFGHPKIPWLILAQVFRGDALAISQLSAQAGASYRNQISEKDSVVIGANLCAVRARLVEVEVLPRRFFWGRATGALMDYILSVSNKQIYLSGF